VTKKNTFLKKWDSSTSSSISETGDGVDDAMSVVTAGGSEGVVVPADVDTSSTYTTRNPDLFVCHAFYNENAD